jgi:hypothetical protein
VCVEATSSTIYYQTVHTHRDRLADIPVWVAYLVDIYGWPVTEAEHELGKVLIATGVYDKILKAFGQVFR